MRVPLLLLLPFVAVADVPFDGLGLNLGNLYRTSPAQSRSVNPENPTGEKGRAGMATEGTGAGPARELGRGWKISAYYPLAPHAVLTLADVAGPGAVQQIWMTPGGPGGVSWEVTRSLILRCYWDGETDPSVECPLGDFFACGWGRYCAINSLPVCVNPRSGLNCYWTMPFHRRARLTVENRSSDQAALFYQINYTLTPIPDDAGTFHAQFRRENPVRTKGIYTILDGVEGVGQYVGTYLAWGSRSTGWWGEGEIKFYLDGDRQFPTICGTGAEDYFGGSFGFALPGADGKDHYQEFSTPYSGMPQVIRPDGLYDSQTRFGLYRWHILDPIRFQRDLRVTIQDLGWQSGHRFRKLQDDIASVAFWYQKEPHRKFPPLPGADELEWH